MIISCGGGLLFIVLEIATHFYTIKRSAWIAEARVKKILLRKLLFVHI